MMPRHRHILITQREERDYTRPPGGGGAEFRLPSRDRHVHAQKLLTDIRDAKQAADELAARTGHIIHDLCLEVVGEDVRNFDLKLESLQDSVLGIELQSVRQRNGCLHAIVYVPEGQLEKYVRKIERYENENSAKSGRPKNENLVAGISSVRFPVLRSFWTDDDYLYPATEDSAIWWEVWIRVGPGEGSDEAFTAFIEVMANSEIRLSQHAIRFPERLVFLAFGAPAQWTRIFVPLLDRIAELRRAKEVPTDKLKLPAADQRAFVQNLATRIIPPDLNAPAVCLLDYGVHRQHPLLEPLLSATDVHKLDPGWTAVDHAQQHGTEMAGIIGYGTELPNLLNGDQPFTLSHRLESVRMFHSGHPHPEETWGYVTQSCLAQAEIQAPWRTRVACLPVTANDHGRDQGRPTSWSAAIDQHASGQLDEDQEVRRLYVIAAGNVRDVITSPNYDYIQSNITSNGIEDPGQSWNALTVGACTHNIGIRSAAYDGYQPLAPAGGLCPTSRTSTSWKDNTWPLKPDIVLEGGNFARSPDGRIDGCDDLSLLTTSMDVAGRLLTWIGDTSAATAQAARLAAILMADYPELWPETIRGLLVHSANWTDEMCRQAPGDREIDKHRRLRCFGYGIPNLERARYTAENHVSLVHQGYIQPYKLDGAADKTNHFVLHSLPWPKAALRALHDQDVTVRITLSYFVEPSPAGRGWGTKFRYASHGLRFALRGPNEQEERFRQRVSKAEWEEEAVRPSIADPIAWVIGRVRTRGSIHSDWWTTSAADVAECGQIAVFPVTGWWRERKHLGFVAKRTRYSLIITISTPDVNVDLYTPIAQQVGLVTQVDA